MILTKLRSFAVLWAFLMPVAVFSAYRDDVALENIYEELKQSGEHYSVVGVICEQVARLQLKHLYPEPTYSVETSITYANQYKTLGELDVVVFQNSNREAILVGEVKCWDKLKDAYHKADQQRSKFERIMRSHQAVDFHSDSDHYAPEQFSHVSRFVAISQNGGENAGFEMSLDFSLQQLMGLRQRLLDCQSRGECLRPLKEKHRKGNR